MKAGDVLIIGLGIMVWALIVLATNAVGHAYRTDDIQNEHCTRGDKKGGGRLVKGLDNSYICIDPRAVKWESK